MSMPTNIPDPSAAVTHDLPNAPGTAVMPDASRRAGGWALLLRGPANKICLGIVAVYLIIGLLSLVPAPATIWGVRRIPGVSHVQSFDQLIQYKYDATQDYAPPAWTFTDEQNNRHFSPAAWFGLDIQGHSVFWRVLSGARTALLITVLASALMLSIGTVLGLTAGYFGGWIDDLITWLYSVIGTIPWLLLVIAVTYILQQNAALDEPVKADAAVGWWGRFIRDLLPQDLVIIILSLGLTDWVSLCRLIRGETIKLRDSDMVAAGRALGLTEPRILFRHIFPNVSYLVIINFTLGAISYLQVEVVLAFLGIGVNSKPSWGRMIDDAKTTLLRGVWWEVTFATAAIFVICMALTLLGDSLRDALDPKLRGRN